MRNIAKRLKRMYLNSFFRQELQAFVHKGDIVLLCICLFITAFSCLILSSCTAAHSTSTARFLIIQGGAAVIGVVLYAMISSIDLEFLAEHRAALTMFNIALLLMLVPFGVDHNSGNKSWIALPGVPFDIQPAEICKIFYIIIMASVMSSHQNRLSSIPSVMHMGFHLALLAGVNMALSRDLGVTLIFVFLFAAMAYTGGVKLWWFLIGGGVVAAAWPVFWNRMTERQQQRILVVFDPTIDPQGQDARFHISRSLRSLTGGGLTGQGLFNGNRTQAGALQAQHTDFIFSAIGEELGYLGCLLVILMMAALIGRCIWVGLRSTDYMRRMVCFGAAAALIFQVFINVGMNLGVVPVIGLTLPLISYGGSSTVSIYAMLGLVSGVYARPAPRSHERYIQPPR